MCELILLCIGVTMCRILKVLQNEFLSGYMNVMECVDVVEYDHTLI